MKEKEHQYPFFTRLLMLAVMLAVLFGVIFGMTSAKNQDMSPENRCRKMDLLLYYRLERKYSGPGCRGIPKRGDIVYRAYFLWRERKIR